MKKIGVLVVLGFGMIVGSGALATVPDMIPVQGVLADASDQPIDALTDLTFTLYDDSAGTTVLWTDTFADVDVVEGFFTVYLGSSATLDFSSLVSNSEVWLGITVETDPEMDRIQLASVPFAMEAQVCQAVGSLTETDINNDFMSSSSAAAAISSADITNWNTAYGWGDHSAAGYLTGFTESDPVFSASTAYGIDATDVTNWDTAYSWGDHAGLYSLTGHDHDADYSSIIHEHDADYVNVTGDTMTGDLNIEANLMVGLNHELDTTVDNYFFGGGEYNKIRHDLSEHSAIASGRHNFIGLECDTWCDSTSCPTDPDGCLTEGSAVSSPYSFIGSGQSNTLNNDYGVIGGGRYNHISRLYSVIGGGRNNVTLDDYSVIVGGSDNLVNEYGEYSFIGGGYDHLIRTIFPNNRYNTIVGGYDNHILNSYEAFIGGGSRNQIFYGPYSTIGGGRYNLSFEKGSTIAGGEANHIVGEYSTIGGGRLNLIDGYSFYSTIPGGKGNRIDTAHNSFAGGVNARVTHNNSFVWSSGSCDTSGWSASATMGNHGANQSDTTGGALQEYCDHSICTAATDASTESTAHNQFMVRAHGGFVFYTAATSTTTGVQLPAGSGSWSSLSDRNAKENFVELDGEEVLDKICDMEMSTWNYITQDDSIRHAGPMAQDFYEAFGLGEDERRLSSVDMDGIAFAAIKELKQQKDAEIAELKETIELLVKRVEDLEGR